MIPRIKTVEPKDSYKLYIVFEDGSKVMYDVGKDIDMIPDIRKKQA